MLSSSFSSSSFIFEIMNEVRCGEIGGLGENFSSGISCLMINEVGETLEADFGSRCKDCC